VHPASIDFFITFGIVIALRNRGMTGATMTKPRDDWLSVPMWDPTVSTSSQTSSGTPNSKVVAAERFRWFVTFIPAELQSAGHCQSKLQPTIENDPMSVETVIPERTGRDLLEATRPFAVEILSKSWWYVGSTFATLIGVLTIAGLAWWWPLRLAASIVGGLLFVRAFILYHDFLHGSLLRGSRFAKTLFYTYGMIALTPPENWRSSHNFHHANVGKPITSQTGKFLLLTSDIGSFPLMTTVSWNKASTWQRLRYRIMRHPLTLLCAYLTVFFGSRCLMPLLRNPRQNREAALSLFVHGGIIALLWRFAGFQALFFSFLLPFAIASASGAYLFFAQHNFKGMRILPIDEWTHYRGALESSSYMKLGPIMRWFTGNIGYHHIHHLNALIPFYRLPEAMNAIPELQHPCVTSLHPSDVLTCLRLNLWDLEKQELVTFEDAAVHTGSTEA
jgi:omega-6 fatty acid desaturase (delta-12 desaturase)